MDLTDKIINQIKINRISTTEIADVLGKTGLLDHKLKPLTPKKFIVGRIFYAPSFNQSNWYTHFFLQDAPPQSVVYVEGVNCAERAIFGALVAKYAILYKQTAGMVVSGYLRDIHQLLKEEYPIWFYGGTPIGCFNKDSGIDQEYYEKRKQEFEGAILIADDSGVILVKKESLTEKFLQGLEQIEYQEDIWFDCIDRLKYSTFETICLRKYEKTDDHS